MQPTLFSYVIELTKKIKFPCVVNGRELSATVTHKEDDGSQVLYHVVFSDGYKGVYLPGEPVLQDGFGCTRTLDAYEDAIYDDLSIIQVLAGSRHAYVRVAEEGGESFNVWIVEKNGRYKILYKGMHQFTLRKTHRWEVSAAGKGGFIINHRMSVLLSRYIDENFMTVAKQVNKVA